MQSKNLACEWNDVALLTDQRACTFLSKAMLRLPEPENGQLKEIRLKEWSRAVTATCENCLTGSVWVELLYWDSCGAEKEYFTELRFLGVLNEPVLLTGEASLLYSRGQVVGEYLLLEMVVQLPRTLQLQPTQVIAGYFEMAEELELPPIWPDCIHVLTTATSAETETCTIRQQMLLVEGRYRITIVYANESQEGECLFAWQQYRSFLWEIPVPEGLQELTGVEPYYQSLSVELLDSRRIRLYGNGVIGTLPAVRQADSMGESSAEKVAIQPQSPSVINSRGSRRASLSRYMRDLNGMAQRPNTIRNYEFSEMGPDNGYPQTE